MLFDEKEMLEICNKYGIEVVESNGYPLDNGIEMNPETFSFKELMNEHKRIQYKTSIVVTESIKTHVSIEKTKNSEEFMSSTNTCCIEAECVDESITSTMNDISLAA